MLSLWSTIVRKLFDKLAICMILPWESLGKIYFVEIQMINFTIDRELHL